MAQKKRYAVRKGKHRGVFSTWKECAASVQGYTGAQYKSYPSLDAAQAALNESYRSQINTRKTSIKTPDDTVIQSSICVDAACSSNPGVLEWRGAHTISGKILFSSTQYPLGTTNVGEWIALVQGMQYLHHKGAKGWTIYSDSRIALGRVRKRIINTRLEHNARTQELWQLIDQSLSWLQSQGSTLLQDNTILLEKRPTKQWGEIPADYGRK